MARPAFTVQTDPTLSASADAAEIKAEAAESSQPLQTAKRSANPSLLRFYLRKWRKLLYDRLTSQQLADLIKLKKFKEANELVSNPKTLVKINPRFQDEQGNTYLHLAVKIGTWDMVNISTKVGCPQNIPNNEDQLPFDITSSFREIKGVGSSRPDPFGTSAERKKRRAAFVEQMSQDYREEFSGAVFPGRRVVSSLDLYFECEEGRCDLPDTWPELNELDRRRLTLHERLALANQVSSASEVTEAELISADASNCYVTATITFVVSRNIYIKGQVPHELVPITLQINVPEYIIHTQGNVYAHAEEILFDYLNNLNLLTLLVDGVRRKATIQQPGHKCYAIIFDLHTTFNMCRTSCEKMMYTLQGNRSPGSLMYHLEIALVNAGFILPEIRKEYEILTPLTSRLYVTTRVSCHRTYPDGVAQDERGISYPSFEDGSLRECNIVNHRNAVIFHLQYDTPLEYRKLDLSASRQRFSPAYVPCQTAFLMKPRPKTRRYWEAQPVRSSPQTRLGLFIDYQTFSRPDSFPQKEDRYLWKYVSEGRIEIIQSIIAERKGNKKALADFLLYRTAEGETIFHAATRSQQLDMLKFIDETLAAYFPAERIAMISDVQHSPLNVATSYELFHYLIKAGALDEFETNLKQIGANFTEEQQATLTALYAEKGLSRKRKLSGT